MAANCRVAGAEALPKARLNGGETPSEPGAKPKRQWPTKTAVAKNQRAKYSNDLLALPGAPPGTTQEGKRWRDLVRHYAARLGNQKMADEGIRAQLAALITATLLLERLQAKVARGEEGSPYEAASLAQTIGNLLERLGLTNEVPKDDPAPPRYPTTGALGRALVQAGYMDPETGCLGGAAAGKARDKEGREREQRAVAALWYAENLQTAWSQNCEDLPAEWRTLFERLAARAGIRLTSP